MAEPDNVYVKISQSGRLIERVAHREIDHATLRATGWVLKSSKNAPTKKDETATTVSTGLTNAVPTSQRAQAEAASAGTAGKKADAKSQAAAGH